MTDAVNIAGATQAASTARAVVSAPVATALPANDSSTIKAAPQVASISPRIIVDPIAGAITEFLNGSGQVQSQVPSAAAVAYLRVGLTADGQPKPESSADTKRANSTVA